MATRLPIAQDGGVADTKLVKSAGEHWVCAALAMLGWAPALTRDGLERTDLLAVETRTGRMIEIQVKAASHMSQPNWRVNTKAQQASRADHEWFVFVALAKGPGYAPRSFVVPRDHVAAAAWIRHKDWLTDPAVEPGRRNAGLDQARIQDWVLTGYEERWELLKDSAYVAPVLLPTEFRKLARSRRVGLPPGHSWRNHLPAW